MRHNREDDDEPTTGIGRQIGETVGEWTGAGVAIAAVGVAATTPIAYVPHISEAVEPLVERAMEAGRELGGALGDRTERWMDIHEATQEEIDADDWEFDGHPWN